MTTLIIVLSLIVCLAAFVSLGIRYYNAPKVEREDTKQDRIEIEAKDSKHENKMEEREQKHRLKEARKQSRLKRKKEWLEWLRSFGKRRKR